MGCYYKLYVVFLWAELFLWTVGFSMGFELFLWVVSSFYGLWAVSVGFGLFIWAVLILYASPSIYPQTVQEVMEVVECLIDFV